MLSLAVTFTPLQLCERGQYLAAAESLGLRVGEWPKNVLGGKYAQAEAILASGIIVSSIGGIQSTGDQSVAREMFSAAATLYGDDPMAHVARAWLAFSDYWEGNFDLALERIEESLKTPIDDTTRMRLLLLRAGIYSEREQAHEAFAEFEEMGPLYESCELLRGKFHCQRGRALRQLKEYDRAIIDYSTAVHFFEELGDVRCQAVALNNLAGILCETKQFPEAHKRANRARELFRKLGDKAYEAQALDQIALIHVAQAEEISSEAIGLIHYSDQGMPDCLDTLTKIKQQSTLKSLSALPYSDNTYDVSPKTHPYVEPSTRSDPMTPLECASELLANQPDLASVLFDLIVLIRTVRDDPAFEADLDEVEDRVCEKIPELIEQRKAYRRSRLLRLVTSRKGS